MKNKVKKFREQKSIKREDFSKIMSVSYSHQTKIELNLKQPSRKYIETFYKKFKVKEIEAIFFN